mmetsp:Transcript_9219/g.16219  ORF Transcript_9219/g.16219 Transcript_9219/m.16219 type:complete len:98 (+) Transcript_9219:106-399(+)|eukprot:CAMPEP_0119106628 /NCGR_PEP_ID=MMETSP1180-20130426/5421_1 /TAXON_ID=3052 ORGANISM="Chlamydomonas cf sp, Strain CCMP681" /NCGR_SAMPLE_ID=MMETSP1180 /ASSEMBLY_ACC=CAM_ASM_000741 /LENGTH=97 /DNA_ID=CAMNT_0007091993 /DNA_START=79 /DNA_END=372 /DNA_ORIENTATION=+
MASDEQAEAVPMEVAPPLLAPDSVKAAELAALNVHKKLNMQAAPIRHYLEAAVVPVLMQGMQALCKDRPENPVEYLAYYLLAHNPQNTKSDPPSQPQ